MLLATAITWQCISDDMYQTLYITGGQTSVIASTLIKDRERSLKAMLGAIFLFISGLWSVKFSFLIFFRRLGDNVAGQKYHWWMVFLFTLATYFIGIGTIQFQCLGPSFTETVLNCSGRQTRKFQRITLGTNLAWDVLTDLASKRPPPNSSYEPPTYQNIHAVLSIPIGMLCRVHISTQQKFALGAIFCLLVITMVVAIIRFTVVMAEREESCVFFWNTIENTVGKENALFHLVAKRVCVSLNELTYRWALLIAITIVCLGSFRALFTNPHEQTKLPFHPQDDSRKRIPCPTKDLEPWSLWHHSWPSRSNPAENIGVSRRPQASDKRILIIPLDRVVVRN